MYSASSPLPQEPLLHVAYLYDDTLEGLLSCIFATYANHEIPEDILPSTLAGASISALQQRLGQSTRVIETNFDHALRVRNGIVREGGNDSFYAILRASCADDPQKGIIIYRFVHYLMDKRSRRNRRENPLNDLANPLVNDLLRLRRRVNNEEEHLKQFMRFNQLQNGVWFARCHPACSAIPLLMDYFQARFGAEPFMIYDEAHTLCGICDGSEWHILKETPILPTEAASTDALFEEAWKRFYHALAIDARYNPELRRSFMPVRFWKNLPEMKPSTAALRIS